jgi:hypothetical protein
VPAAIVPPEQVAAPGAAADAVDPTVASTPTPHNTSRSRSFAIVSPSLDRFRLRTRLYAVPAQVHNADPADESTGRT